jgi:hypothetical protein
MRDSCPEVVTAVADVRSFRPRYADCGPPTDFNLCAFERGYSIETARHAPATGLRSDTKQVGNAVPGHETDLRLTRAPLHTRQPEMLLSRHQQRRGHSSFVSRPEGGSRISMSAARSGPRRAEDVSFPTLAGAGAHRSVPAGAVGGYGASSQASSVCGGSRAGANAAG